MFEIGHNSFVRSHLHPSIAFPFLALEKQEYKCKQRICVVWTISFSFVIVDNKHFKKICLAFLLQTISGLQATSTKKTAIPTMHQTANNQEVSWSWWWNFVFYGLRQWLWQGNVWPIWHLTAWLHSSSASPQWSGACGASGTSTFQTVEKLSTMYPHLTGINRRRRKNRNLVTLTIYR